MLKLSPKSPKKIDSTITALVQYLGLEEDKALRLKFTRPSAFVPEPDYCHFNVWLQIRSAGGAAQPGWILAQDKQNSFAEAIFHAVWRNQTGSLVDVTPRRDMEKRVVFVPDHGRSIVLTSHENRPAIHTFDNVRILNGSLMTPLTEITVVMEGDFPVRQGLWPW